MARRNPRLDTNLVLLTALVAAGGYVLYRLFGAGRRAIAATEQAFSDTSSAVADVAERIFPHGNTTLDPRASIMLGDGSIIPASAPTGVGSFTDTDGLTKIQFYWQGRTYRTTDAQPDGGMYYAA